MIILITGDYGVGKDLFTDFLKESLDNSEKIPSYTTRPIRNKEDLETHLFVIGDIDETYFEKNNIVAYTKINNEFYWTKKEQFIYDYNLYVIDKQSIQQVIDSKIDDIFIVEIIRDSELITVSESRKNREKHDANIQNSYIVENNGTIEELKSKAEHLAFFLTHNFFSE